MPHNKDLKRLIRSRMSKTGEAYTSARAQILKKPKSPAASRANRDAAPPGGIMEPTRRGQDARGTRRQRRRHVRSGEAVLEGLIVLQGGHA